MHGSGIGRCFCLVDGTLNIGELERILTKERGDKWTVINNFIEVSKEIYDANPNSENGSDNT